jgi:FMNH2-dependent dimethyl sulfone monooxygenase
MMRFGYWLPVFGGWLRNVPDEAMEGTWDYCKRLAQRSEQLGFDLSLIAELNLNDIKGPDAPSLDAWSTAAALMAAPPFTHPHCWPNKLPTSTTSEERAD